MLYQTQLKFELSLLEKARTQESKLTRVISKQQNLAYQVEDSGNYYKSCLDKLSAENSSLKKILQAQNNELLVKDEEIATLVQEYRNLRGTVETRESEKTKTLNAESEINHLKGDNSALRSRIQSLEAELSKAHNQLLKSSETDRETSSKKQKTDQVLLAKGK